MERDITDICSELNNWFSDRDERHAGEYTIENGTIALPFLRDGQFFRIVGSIFNDGVHVYPAYDLADETFSGSIWGMRIPPLVVELAADIGRYKGAYEADGSSPYVSESFGGYSYTRPTNSKGQVASWQDVFAKRLNRWRKLP